MAGWRISSKDKEEKCEDDGVIAEKKRINRKQQKLFIVAKQSKILSERSGNQTSHDDSGL